MDERTLRALEFPRVLERLSSFCLSEAGKEAALLLRPMTSAEDVRRAQYLYDEIRSWMAEGDFSLVSFPDISGLLAYVHGHTDPLLEMDGLWALKNALGLARRAADSIHAGAARRPLLDALANAQPMPELSLSALNRCVGDDGYLKDESSPGLLLVRSELRGIHQNCLRRVKECVDQRRMGRNAVERLPNRQNALIPCRFFYQLNDRIKAVVGVTQQNVFLRNPVKQTLIGQPRQCIRNVRHIAERVEIGQRINFPNQCVQTERTRNRIHVGFGQTEKLHQIV